MPSPDNSRKGAYPNRFKPGQSGNPAKKWKPGQSGNPGGRPRGYSVKRIMSEVLADGGTVEQAILRVRENLKSRKEVLPALEFAARVNREVGIGSEQAAVNGVTFVFTSNIRPEALRRKRGA